MSDDGVSAARRPLRQTAVVALVLLLAVVSAALVGPWELRSGPLGDGRSATAPEATVEPGESLDPVSATPPADLDPPDSPPPDLRWLAYVAAGFVVAALLGLLLRWLAYRRRPLDPEPDRPDRLIAPGEVAGVPELPVLRRGVEAAHRHLAEIREPGDAIVAAWLALEDAAASAGVRRRPAETPTEFTVDVLGRTSADPEATQRLLHLYHRARFAMTPVRPEDAVAAAECLTALAVSWEAVHPHDAGASHGPVAP